MPAFAFCRSQVISGIVLDSLTKMPLGRANVFATGNGFTAFTDGDGKFKIKVADPNARLLVSYVGYENKTVAQSALKPGDVPIYLKPKSEQLPEITLGNSAKKYSVNKSVKPDENGKTQFLSFQFGTENCTYVQNPYNQPGKIQSVSLHLKKLDSHPKDCPKCEVDYLASYNIWFYRYDSIAQRPGAAIYTRPIVVTPQNKNYRFTVNVDSLSIAFPKNGVCVGVEFLNMQYENPKRTGAFIGPLMEFAQSRKMHPITAWRRYRAEGWKFITAITTDDKGKKYDFMTVGLIVQTEK